uniref:CRN2 n=1 Tax=Albugo laibachii Nc14 TaxID=890382 RepID=F0WME6_9STRA|nr:CRN2 [Albugo laibachii Nc14]|eukprot:CCA22478.1 CRN2 [Albugo laibachii Nc14]
MMVPLVCAIVGGIRKVFTVNIDADTQVHFFKDAIKAEEGDLIRCDAAELTLYLAKKGAGWFSSDDLDGFNSDNLSRMIEMNPILPINDILYFGRDFQPGNAEIHVLVVVPRRKFYSLAGLEIEMFRRTMFSQPEVDTLRKECIQLPKWKTGIVHNIPSIWKFVKQIGGCTRFGKILWRLEVKQVLSTIQKDWRKAFSKKGPFVDTELRSIVIGSPGVGKSTLVVLLVFYMFFKYQKNVLFYRRVVSRVH